MVRSRTRTRLALSGGGVVGFGLGAVLDVIVFHLILQSHHLLSSRIDPETLAGLRANIYYDGLFSLGMLLVTLVGAGLLWWAANDSSYRLSTLAVVGSLLIGLGAFNTYDGLVDHYVLELHNVVHGTTVWNPPWVVVSLVLLGVGAGLLQLGRR